jgi:hypothetical protein
MEEHSSSHKDDFLPTSLLSLYAFFVSVWQEEALLISAGKGANAWFSFYNSCVKDFSVTCHPTFIFHPGYILT